MSRRNTITLTLLAAMFAATAIAPRPSSTVTLGTKALRGVAIGYVVKQSAGGLNKFINTITFNHNVPDRLSTKVVPILSVGEKGYVGGAQVSGPAAAVRNVKAVWQYEDNFSNNRFRLKVLVPSDSLSPLKISRVSKVGVSALIDVSLAGGWEYDTVSRGVKFGDVLLAAGVAVAVKNAGPAINKAINTISFNKGLSTKVVPMATFGEKAYIGGAQVSGSANVINSVNAVYQYEDFFSGGRFRVKVMVPTTSSNPLKLKRVQGAGVTAVVDMSLARQRDLWDRDRDRYLFGRYQRRYDVEDRYRYRRDQGLHKGWWQGKHKGWHKKGKGGEKIEDKFGVNLGLPDRDRDDDKDRDEDRDRDRDKHRRGRD
ncbi:MAG: hypothetical protein Q7T82_13325 [Armatimonadota bacterium]|nr:hypothetical protein [Armatimonadota bacterium]